MCERPLISVIVPVYNVEKYLRKCVDSILKQTYTNLEIILVDDGSPDHSPAICDEFAKEDDRVVVIHKENGGLSSARNAGLDACRGLYVGFVDSDDYIEPDMYRNLLSAVGKEEDVIGVAAIAHETEDGSVQCIVHGNAAEETKEQYIESLLLHKGDEAVWSKLFSRNMIGPHRFDEAKLNEDFLFFFEIEKNFKKLRYTSPVGYHYIIHNGSISRTFGKAIHDIVGNAKTVRQYIERNYPRFAVQAERLEIYQNMAFLWHVPAGYDRREDPLCETAMAFLKRNFRRGMRNPYLNVKDKIRLMILMIAPVTGPAVYNALKQG